MSFGLGFSRLGLARTWFIPARPIPTIIMQVKNIEIGYTLYPISMNFTKIYPISMSSTFTVV